VKYSRPVYATGVGRLRQPTAPADRPARGVPNDGVVRISREHAHRGGKTVTVIRGLTERGPKLTARVAELKRLCGAGGTLREASVEIQGDHRERIAERLRALGYQVKFAGG